MPEEDRRQMGPRIVVNAIVTERTRAFQELEQTRSHPDQVVPQSLFILVHAQTTSSVGNTDDRQPLARSYAAVALGEMGKTASAALPKLKEMQTARDFRVSGAARKAVSQIRGLPSLTHQLGVYKRK